MNKIKQSNSSILGHNNISEREFIHELENSNELSPELNELILVTEVK